MENECNLVHVLFRTPTQLADPLTLLAADPKDMLFVKLLVVATFTFVGALEAEQPILVEELLSHLKTIRLLLKLICSDKKYIYASHATTSVIAGPALLSIAKPSLHTAHGTQHTAHGTLLLYNTCVLDAMYLFLCCVAVSFISLLPGRA